MADKLPDGEYLFYEQDEVYTIPTSPNEMSIGGYLRIIEKRHGVVIEWKCAEDDSSGDSEWAVINEAAVTFSHHNITDSVEISSPHRNAHPILLELVDLRSYKIGQNGSLVLIQRDGTTNPALEFRSGSVEFFVEVLSRYVSIRESEREDGLFLVSAHSQPSADERLLALNLVPRKRVPGVAVGLWGEGGDWGATQQRVWGFFSKLKKDPYTTTLNTLSKVYETVLYNGVEGYVHSDQRTYQEEDLAELLSSFKSLADLEPGYEVLTEVGKLRCDRPSITRMAPLTHEELGEYVDVDGRVLEEDALRERIFKGGIHPSMRRELWSILLCHTNWNETYAQREQQRKKGEETYYVMKQQWLTLSSQQEANFTAYKERHSLIEKDVNRTDRNLPFYEGEHSANLVMLHDILTTYVMYNFDLGYVQGMSDLLAPILYVTQNEATAFWCFVGYMNLVQHNFEMDQAGMKHQLASLQHLVRVVDPEFMSYLEAHESSNFFFCFRWLLVRFKRELNYTSTLRLWEVLWTGKPCPNFHLLVAVALLDTEKNTIVENKFGFAEILKHINDISLRIDLESILKKAEAIYLQLKESLPLLPNPVREVLGFPLKEEPPSASPVHAQLNSKVLQETPSDAEGGLVGMVTTLIGSAARHFGVSDSVSDDRHESDQEDILEFGLSNHYV